MELSAYLKKETKELHEETEKSFAHFHLFSDDFHIDHYKKLLEVQYQWHKSIEYLVDHANCKYPYHKKSRLLEKDLNSLGQKVSIQPLREDLDYHHLGLLYVMEGSMLGASMMHQFFVKKKLIEENVLNYYKYCSNDGARTWPSFVKYLNKPEFLEQKEQLLASAKYAFNLISKYAEKCKN
ncbi:MAG: biliverdin-producing heme oxygenase [Ekhidna sp.]|nr:biliverdin-producing heme oxygenase [Ekhidna sp.]